MEVAHDQQLTIPINTGLERLCVLPMWRISAGESVHIGQSQLRSARLGIRLVGYLTRQVMNCRWRRWIAERLQSQR